MNLKFRMAQKRDLEVIVAMLADDPLGMQREDANIPLNSRYGQLFEQIDKDPNNELIVADCDEQVAGMLQLTFIPYLTYMGSWRCLIEGVRIHKQFRSQGLGEKMFEFAIQRAREKGCRLVQLTSDKQRIDAIRFYEKLGFTATHEGFKLSI